MIAIYRKWWLIRLHGSGYTLGSRYDEIFAVGISWPTDSWGTVCVVLLVAL